MEQLLIDAAVECAHLFGHVGEIELDSPAANWVRALSPVSGDPARGMIISNTVKSAKVAITIDRRLLGRVDALVSQRAFPSRSSAIQKAVEEKLARIDRSRLARECAKLDPKAEQALADQGLDRDLAEWPEY